MQAKPSLDERLKLFRERLMSIPKGGVNPQIFNQYNRIEKEFKNQFSTSIISERQMIKPKTGIMHLLFFPDNLRNEDERSEILERLEIMLSYCSNETKVEKTIVNYIIKNFHQQINSLKVDNSQKQIINKEFNILVEELQKEKKDKKKIKDKILELLQNNLSIELVKSLIRILMEQLL
jgi:hypothetical protein